ncbi:MAG: four helix bundle protein [Prolixibacteraceae bacterium]|nr:four helix bundle protein [Prolixibacteraceae bacterium]
MKENIVKNKSFAFAVRIVKLYQFLVDSKKEFVLSKQLLRSGTSVGAMVREAEHAESKPDFIHKMAIAQKEINETIYWLELLAETNFLTKDQFDSMNSDAEELIRLVTRILKSTKSNQPH